ncbi:hypothetical protein DVH05_027814 [Phytophthora capsici]|nr:hypothetical protein DVH05_027814 [Phytophthora capsici]
MSEAFAVIDDGAGSPPPADEASFTRLSVHQSHEDALAAMELVEGDRYLFLYNNGYRGHNAVYICATHIACSKLMRLVDDAGDESIALEESGTHGRWRFALETSGVHTGNESEEKKSGIASALKRDVDSLLIGAGPAKCAKLLKQRYKDDAVRLRLMPDEEQLKNRKSQLRRTLQGMFTLVCVFFLMEC